MRALRQGLSGVPEAVRARARVPRRLSHALLALALVAVAPLAPRPVLAGDGFVAEIPDLPLMPGLTELSDAGVVFDKPSGRIVEAYAQGVVSRDAVQAFYRDSLPQLGWSPATAERFTRDGEALTIEIVEGAQPLTLRFTLRPQ